jgi:hypothetical protein
MFAFIAIRYPENVLFLFVARSWLIVTETIDLKTLKKNARAYYLTTTEIAGYF